MPDPQPTRIRKIRISTFADTITIYGTFATAAEVALKDSWLSIYEREYLRRLLPKTLRDGDDNDAFDMIEMLRQVRVTKGYRPKDAEVDDLYNLGLSGDASIPIIANYATQKAKTSFADRFKSVKTTGENAAANSVGPARVTQVGSLTSSRIAAIVADANLARDDKTVLASIQILTFMNWLVQPVGAPPLTVPLTMGGVTFSVPPLDVKQQQAYKSAYNLGDGSLVALRRLAQEILESIFSCAGVTPSWWQWPAVP